jgi:hypothetical protein
MRAHNICAHNCGSMAWRHGGEENSGVNRRSVMAAKYEMKNQHQYRKAAAAALQ